MQIAFVDTETSGTNPLVNEAWQFGVVLDDGNDRKIQAERYTTELQRPDLADLRALDIGGYWTRKNSMRREWVAERLVPSFRGRVLASCNVSFDVEFLRKFLASCCEPAPWHYSPIDVKSIACAALHLPIPTATDEIAERLGLEPRKGAHDALQDAELARDIFWAARRHAASLQRI